MAIKNEIKIGILGAFTLAILIFGYKYLKGSNLLDRSRVYYIIYDQVDQLGASAPVYIHGLKVGNVLAVELNPKNVHEILVTIDVSRKINLPSNTEAYLQSSGIMGGKNISLIFHEPCTDNCLPAKSFIKGVRKSFIKSMISEDEISAYASSIGSDMKIIVDSLNKTLADPNSNGELQRSYRAVESTLKSLASATAHINNVLASSEKAMSHSFKNIEILTQTLAKSNLQITNTISNLESITTSLKKAEPGKLVNSTQETMDETKVAIQKLSKTIEESQKAVAQLNNILADVQKDNGSLGKLLHDKDLYDNLEKSSKNLDLLLQDIRLNPKRYIHVNVFGGKNIPYQTPTDDPGNK